MPATNPDKATLTTKQELFVAAYLGAAHGNATEAARMAGYKQPQMQGPRLMKNDVIAARVSQHVETAGVTAEQVLAELADVALADWREFVIIRTNPKTGAQIDVKMDLTNKVKALELLGKFHQLFVDRQVVDVNVREHRVGVPQSTLNKLFQPAERLNA